MAGNTQVSVQKCIILNLDSFEKHKDFHVMMMVYMLFIFYNIVTAASFPVPLIYDT